MGKNGREKGAGAPRTIDREAVAAQFEAYIAATEIPIIVEFCALHRVSREFIYQNDDFAELRTHCIAKKEAALERLGLTGKVDTRMAMFSLTQLGWSNKQDVTHKGDAAHPIMISPTAAKW